MRSELLLLLALASGVWSDVSELTQVCSQAQIKNCDDCIRAGPFCMWCKTLNFTKTGEQDAVRCDTEKNLIARGCNKEDIIDVKNTIKYNVNKPLTDKFTRRDKEYVQLSPQDISLKLRPGLPQTFRVHFKRAEGYPVDLYYLMDLSFSMKDDLQNIKTLGSELFQALNSITEHGRIGFGAFVDKTVLPFTNTNPDKLLRPCEDSSSQCQPAFGYYHVLNLTDSEDEFNREVVQQSISGNLDKPEGSLDAMMQATVCGDLIGWRNNSTRLLVLATDDGFHMAGDGRLAGILEPNDETCHLFNKQYTHSHLMDYPSVGQLALQLEKHHIQPIFAVTRNVLKIYENLSKMIPKSEVGELSADSNNVVKLIKDAYNKLSSKVELTHNSQNENLRVTFSPNCEIPEFEGESKGVCNNVAQGTEISFDVTVESHQCLSEPETFNINPLGIKDTLKITVEGDCECNCGDSMGGTADAHCNGKGTVHCGICRCIEGTEGQFCNCSTDQRVQIETCRRDNSSAVCGGRGDCVCGRCVCHRKPKSGITYHGAVCECDDEGCGRYANKLCAGNGVCKCDKCHCYSGYSGAACECETSEQSCTVGGVVCNGRGTCTCNKCHCDRGYMPPFCLNCPSCTEPCQQRLPCVECLAFDIGGFKKNCSVACKNTTLEVVEHLGSDRRCELRDSEGCWVRYKLQQLEGREKYKAEVLLQRDCPPSLVAIVASSVVAVALVGLLLLLLVKLLIYMNDLKEFRKFENEKKKSRWAEADNPLFQNATTTVTNPTFTGE